MRYVSILGVLLAARALPAQQGTPAAGSAPPPASVARAAEVITTEEMARHVGVLAADSMRDRGTPSPALDRTARYVAGEFAKLGLTTSLQPYLIPGSRALRPAESRVVLISQARNRGKILLDERGSEMMKSVAVTFAGDARPAVGALSESGSFRWEWFLGGAESKPTGVTVVSGRHTAASIARAGVRQDIVLYVPPAGLDSATQHQVIERLRRTASVVVLSDDDSATFARRRQDAFKQPTVVVEDYIAGAMGAEQWAVYVRADALRHFWRFAGVDLERAQADTAPAIRRVAATSAMLRLRQEEADSNGPKGVNVVGVLQGTDPQLANEYVVYSAPMDGGRAGGGDAAGVAGLVALAKAFSQPGARPRRSLVFLATSGAAAGAPGYGANFFVQSQMVGPLVLDVTLGDIGAGARDSVVISGVDDANFAIRPDWVAAKHPELGLTAANGGTISDPSLEHFAFVRRAIPALAFHGRGRDADVDPVNSAGGGDLGKAVTVTRFAYYVGQELASATRRPNWSTAGRQFRLEALER